MTPEAGIQFPLLRNKCQ